MDLYASETTDKILTAVALIGYVCFFIKALSASYSDNIRLAREVDDQRGEIKSLKNRLAETNSKKSGKSPMDFKTIRNTSDVEGRNHTLKEIESACEIVRKDLKDIPDMEKCYAGYVFTDLEDTYFFDQMMAQNQDLKDTIEASMRKFMSDNMKLEPARRFYVPKSTFEKYMRTNEY